MFIITCNIILTIYLFIQINKKLKINKEKENYQIDTTYKEIDSLIDEDMIELYYPEIQFEKINQIV